MKCICRKTCQVRMPDGKIIFYKKNDISEFDKCPNNFDILKIDRKPDEIDFDLISEVELKEIEFNLADLKQFIYDKYGIKSGNRKKEKTIELLMDCRYRAI